MTNPFVLLRQTLMVRKCCSAAYAEGPGIRGVIFNNYWTRLSKIS